MSNKNKNRSGVVYSTDKNFEYKSDDDSMESTLNPEKQLLKVRLDSRMRNGKTVTLVEGFIGTETDLEELGKFLKSKCGVGGTVKDGIILIQGDFKNRVIQLLTEKKYRAR